MRYCGSLSDKGFIIGSNGGVGLAFLQSEHLGTLKVGTMSAIYVLAIHAKENVLQNTMITKET